MKLSRHDKLAWNIIMMLLKKMWFSVLYYARRTNTVDVDLLAPLTELALACL